MGFWNWLNGTPSPEELGEVWLEARQAGDNESMYEAENTMYEEHGLVFDGGMWKPSDHEEPGGNWFTRMFS